MRLRWSATGLLQAEQNFRRIRGHQAMTKLVTALDADSVVDASKAA